MTAVRLKDEAVAAVAAWCRGHSPEKADELLADVAAEVKEVLDREAQERAHHATKQYLIEQYAAHGITLEKMSRFIRWLDRTNASGHQAFLVSCLQCNGFGDVEYAKDVRRTCLQCNGEKTEEGPWYCRECGDLLIQSHAHGHPRRAVHV